MALSAGSRIGPYEIVEAIGAGGMGEVYRARDAKLARDVALKVLPAEFALDPDRLARFTREAQVLASFNHQNIAGIYGFEQGPPEGGPNVPDVGAGFSRPIHALVLEFVDGPTLADRIAQGAIPVDEALPIARQIAEALEAAHEQGIIHRDLKPANIKVRPDGTVKVLDFGLAKLLGPPEGGPYGRDVGAGFSRPGVTASPTITTPAMTQVGMILGTAAYMSPEQAKGREADTRSDIWSFGCVLYEMLTGKRAFEGDDVSDTLAAVLRASPEWSALPADTPSRIRALLERCLRKDAQKRLPHIAVVRLDIDEIATDPSPLVPTAVVRPSIARRAIPIAIGAILAAAITSGAWWMFRPHPTVPLVMRFAITLPPGRLFGGAGRHLLDVSPDGSQLVYVANRQLHRRTMGELDDAPIPGSENPIGVALPVFSPDGRWVAFAATLPGGAGIMKIPVGGGVAQTLTVLPNATFGAGMSWGDDGIVFARGQTIQRLSSNGGTAELLVTLKEGQSPTEPQMLPGGKAVLYTRRHVDVRENDSSEIVVHSLTTATDTIAIKNGANARYLESGHLIYAVGGVLFAVPFDLKRMEVTGEPVAVLSGVRRGAGIVGQNSGVAQFSVSRTGTLIYVPGPASLAEAQQDIALLDRDGRIESLKWPPGAYEAPRISPNGKQVAASSVDAKEATIWLYDLSGTTSPRRLTFGGRNRFPIWSGDSRLLAFQSDRDGDLGIYSQRADGSGPVERLTNPVKGASHVPESWSPDGNHLLFSETKGTEISSWIVSLSNKKVSPFGDIRAQLPINAVFSPDGKWVAYQAGRPGDNGVFVQPFPTTGAKYQISKGSAAHHPAWSRDGKEIIYIPAQANAVVVSVTAQAGFGVSKTTHELPSKGIEGGPGSIRNYDVLPDGRLLGVVNAGAQASGLMETPEIRVVLNWTEELKRLVPTR
jgi:serine/threonine-protein kinase